MKVVFLQRIWRELLGIMYISSLLKEQGHECEVLIVNSISELGSLSADIIGFYCATEDQGWVLNSARSIKSEIGNIPIIIGGPHPTFSPEMIEAEGIDIVCRGEGEYAILELLNNLRDGREICNIHNLWVKQNGKIYKNEVRPLIENLDELPFPDREVYHKYKVIHNNRTKYFMSSRGCPYSCSYCFNHKLRELYWNKGNYIRRRSVDNFLEEIEFFQRKYGLEFLRFEDDNFIIDKEWLFCFLEKKKLKTNLPFLCYASADLLNEEVVKKLKEANCYSVLLGIETGSEERRMKLLNKSVTNKQIIEAVTLLKKYDLKFYTSNILGLPGETLQSAFETIKINIKIKAQDVWCSVFQPYPGLALTEYALEKKFLTPLDLKCSKFASFNDNNLRLSQAREIFNLHKFFYISVWFPFSIPIIKRLIRFPPNPIFKFIFTLCYGLSYRKHCKISIKRLIHEGRYWLNYFLSIDCNK